MTTYALARSTALAAGAPRRARGRAVLGDVVREAAAGLSRNRVRAGLSMLGISWGIVSVVMLLSYGNGFQAALERGFRGAFGDGVVIAWPGQTSAQAGGERAGKRIQLTEADVLSVRGLPFVKFVSPEFIREFPMTWGTKQGSYRVRGVAPEYAVMRSQWVEAGRFPDDDD
ncbi:MAG TPA: ABC transporter permease, partial [Vicinamibacterales bacterium]|nr:ABC transporter permease [Vicinamibacterales bacterium]